MDTNGTQMYMPVAPAYGNMGGDLFGGNSGWLLIFLLICLGGGWGGGFGGGYGNGIFPWMMAGQNNTDNDVQRGFDQAALVNGISGLQNTVTSGFGDVQTALCGGFAGVNANIANGFAQSEIAANARQIAGLQQNFAMQSAMQSGFCGTQSGLADVKYAIATEGANTRASNTAGTQAILDKLCQLELDTYKGQLADANNTISQLRTQLLVANNEASQTAQTAAILAGQAGEVDALYNRLSNCPISTVPVYGRQPIFTCGGNGCGCGMAA